ncbi:MAG: hypothetical protein RSF67_07590, partial [Clostridia bacterium]
MNILRLKPLTIKTSAEYKNQSNDIAIINKQLDRLRNNNDLLTFQIDNFSSKLSFNGIKIIINDEPNLLIRNLLNDNQTYSRIIINDSCIRNKNIFHIDYFTRVSDILNSKKNGLLHEYLKTKDIANNDHILQDFISQSFFNMKDKNLESISTIDFSTASIIDYLEINNDYLTKENLNCILSILKESSTDKILIILNDYNLIPIDEIITNYINDFHFLIFTKIINKWITSREYLELVVI